jgi:serine/threonine protein kinase
MLYSQELAKKRTSLGSGSYGSLYQGNVLRKTDDKVTVKRFHVSPTDRGFRSLREVTMLKALGHHPHIISLRGLMRVTEAATARGIRFDRYEMVYDFETTDARRFVCGWDAANFKRLVRHTLAAVSYCHMNLVMHLDIKLDNILCTFSPEGATFKLADFGFATEMSSSGLYTQGVVTPCYRAPEMLIEEERSSLRPGSSRCPAESSTLPDVPQVSPTTIKGGNPFVRRARYDTAVDIYALAITFLEVLKREHFMPTNSDVDLDRYVENYPFSLSEEDLRYLNRSSESRERPIANYLKCSFENGFDGSPGRYEDFLDLITGMARIQPQNRLDIQGILDHRYIEESGDRDYIIETNMRCGLCLIRPIEVSSLPARDRIAKILTFLGSYGGAVVATAMDVFDRYVNRAEGISADELSILPYTCLYISCKYHTVIGTPPPLTTIVREPNEQSLLSMEDKVLKALEGRVYYGSLLTYVVNPSARTVERLLTAYVRRGREVNGRSFEDAIPILLPLESASMGDEASPA